MRKKNLRIYYENQSNECEEIKSNLQQYFYLCTEKWKSSNENNNYDKTSSEMIKLRKTFWSNFKLKNAVTVCRPDFNVLALISEKKKKRQTNFADATVTVMNF